MRSITPAQTAAANVTVHQKFSVKKRNVAAMLIAICGQRPSPMNPQGLSGLQDRDDCSGKFGRRVGTNRRALERAHEEINEERKALIKEHSEKFPEGHERAGEPTPVYRMIQTAEGEKPIFKKDSAGNDTDEREIIPDEFNLRDREAFNRDLKEMMEECIVIECPGFTVDEFNSFKKIAPRIVDPLLDLEVGGETMLDRSNGPKEQPSKFAAGITETIEEERGAP